MRYLILALVVAAMLLAGGVDAQKTKPAPTVHAPFHGKVVVKEKTSLKSFPRPVLAPPRIMPPLVAGKAWRWHRSFGWVAVDAGVAPAEILLPETFTLPAAVQVYEGSSIAVEGLQQITCPHCGQVILIQR